MHKLCKNIKNKNEKKIIKLNTTQHIKSIPM